MAVREWEDEIVFLHQIVQGGTDRSYGIQVARLAGVPSELIARAREVLRDIERDSDDLGGRIQRAALAAPSRPPGGLQLGLFDHEPSDLQRAIDDLEIEATTPWRRSRSSRGSRSSANSSPERSAALDLRRRRSAAGG